MYGVVDTDASHRHLDGIVEKLDVEYCLIGGWAVHQIVNDRYQALRGREYLGSRDIDLGFTSPDGIERVEDILVGEMGFEFISFRYLKQLHSETGLELSDEEARSLPPYEIFPLYVDVLLPDPGVELEERLGFVPPEEPLLEGVFNRENHARSVRIGGSEVVIPATEVMMAMKLHSVVKRHEDHKRIKDLCDITGLALFSGLDRAHLVRSALSLVDEGRLEKLSATISEGDLAEAASILDLDVNLVRSVAAGFGWMPKRK